MVTAPVPLLIEISCVAPDSNKLLTWPCKSPVTGFTASPVTWEKPVAPISVAVAVEVSSV